MLVRQWFHSNVIWAACGVALASSPRHFCQIGNAARTAPQWLWPIGFYHRPSLPTCSTPRSSGPVVLLHISCPGSLVLLTERGAARPRSGSRLRRIERR